MLKLRCAAKQLPKSLARNKLNDWLSPLQTPLKRLHWRVLLVKRRRVKAGRQQAAEAEVLATVNGVVVNAASVVSGVTAGAAVNVEAASTTIRRGRLIGSIAHVSAKE